MVKDALVLEKAFLEYCCYSSQNICYSSRALASPLNLAAIESDIYYEAIYRDWFCMPVLGST